MDLPLRLPERYHRLSINHFVILMIIVVAIQGTYLGYVVGILTTLERRFGISSEKSGLLLSLYDIGHTVAILMIGYFGSKSHLPRLTGIGVIMSAVAMFILALPVALYGTVNHETEIFLKHKEIYERDFRCDSDRELLTQGEDCKLDEKENNIAYALLVFGQILAGVFAAPFNTLAYVYIDTNVQDRRRSPLLLGLLTSMYAFGPALGFALSAGLTRVYITLGAAPPHVQISDEQWVGAWWLGFVICGILYLLCATPFFFFPRSYKPNGHEMVPLRSSISPTLSQDSSRHLSKWEKAKIAIQEFPYIVWDLMQNPVYITMVIAWMFGSYLIGGYQTYLPKYIETQFGRSASIADFYAGFISIGAVASSTALGGYLLTKYDVAPRKAILYLFGAWIIIMITYLLGMSVGCQQTSIAGLDYDASMKKWSFFDDHEDLQIFSSDCQCQAVFQFDGVHFDGRNFFSPCHAGCLDYDPYRDEWSNCASAMGGMVTKGLVHNECNQIYIYLIVIFIGLFLGNLFFMVTMMIVLRSVYDDQKVMALSLASCATNLLGFIPAPIIFGWIIDSACVMWHSRCPNDRGNCVIYDNDRLRVDFHLGNAVLQFLAVVFVGICYFVSTRVKLPEEEAYEEEMELREHQGFNMNQIPRNQQPPISYPLEEHLKLSEEASRSSFTPKPNHHYENTRGSITSTPTSRNPKEAHPYENTKDYKSGPVSILKKPKENKPYENISMDSSVPCTSSTPSEESSQAKHSYVNSNEKRETDL
ncbi:unnamed protein product [Auanema sp. JU1783]|nr:unnamed protein product [Auanema sp. JU1783]